MDQNIPVTCRTHPRYIDTLSPGDLVRAAIDIDVSHVDDPARIGTGWFPDMTRVQPGVTGLVLDKKVTHQKLYGAPYIKWLTFDGLVGWSYACAFDLVTP